ncbi:MAG: alpha/beta hydrolase [Acidimicrobiia bacterium]|nr:MAG: alpha/beta hydrolase [Acidimicrobiia bacterium]
MIETNDGVRLEAILEVPNDPIGTLVLCHPHPQQGGTMRTPILHEIKKHALVSGLAVLRFNFRGVGASTGSFDNGEGEVQDVAAAMSRADSLDHSPIALSGWSFGAAIALRWQASSGSRATYVGIAPPVGNTLIPDLPTADEFEPARRKFIVGARDQLVDVGALTAYAGSIGATIDVYPSSDHFFLSRRERLAQDVVAYVNGDD